MRRLRDGNSGWQRAADFRASAAGHTGNGALAVRVMAFAPYPETAPSTGYRLAQFREPLARFGIRLEILPFVGPEDYSTLYEARAARKVGVLVAGLRRRFEELARVAAGADVAVVHRELAPLLNRALLGRLLRSGVPYLFDFDDAVYLPPRGGDPLLRLLRRPRADSALLCRHAACVLAGNGHLAAFARAARGAGLGGGVGVGVGLDVEVKGEGETAGEGEGRGGGGGVIVFPTVVDTERFRPPERVVGDGGGGGQVVERVRGGEAEELGVRPVGPARAVGRVPVVGWVGTHTTLPYLTNLYPVLEEVGRRLRFRLFVVANRCPPAPGGVEMEFAAWRKEEEVSYFHAMDVGLYPLVEDAWAVGKCGLKAIQYLACGVPCVASPVGVLPEMVRAGETGLLARTAGEWVDALERLLADGELRARMGAAGRALVVERYSVQAVVGTLVGVLKGVGSRRRALQAQGLGW